MKIFRATTVMLVCCIAILAATRPQVTAHVVGSLFSAGSVIADETPEPIPDQPPSEDVPPVDPVDITDTSNDTAPPEIDQQALDQQQQDYQNQLNVLQDEENGINKAIQAQGETLVVQNREVHVEEEGAFADSAGAASAVLESKTIMTALGVPPKSTEVFAKALDGIENISHLNSVRTAQEDLDQHPNDPGAQERLDSALNAVHEDGLQAMTALSGAPTETKQQVSAFIEAAYAVLEADKAHATVASKALHDAWAAITGTLEAKVPEIKLAVRGGAAAGSIGYLFAVSNSHISNDYETIANSVASSSKLLPAIDKQKTALLNQIRYIQQLKAKVHPATGG